MKGVPLIIKLMLLMLCLASCFTRSKYVLHALAGNRTVKAREEPRMDKLHACCYTRNVVARE